jgi:hypothetical protein
MGKLKFRSTAPVAVAPPQSDLLPFSPPIITSAIHTYPLPSDTNINIPVSGTHVIHLPNEPMTGGFVRVNGGSQGVNIANNIVVIGGDIQPPKVYSSVTKRLTIPFQGLPIGAYYMNATHGFTGATGGKFRVKTAEGPPFYFTDEIDYNASDATVKAAVNAVLQANGWSASECFDVENTVSPNHIGGPWRFIPNETFGLGRCTVVNGVISPLTGTPAFTTRTTIFAGRSNGFQPIQWRDHCHIEGLKVYSPDTNDALNVSSSSATSVLTIQNCHFRTGDRVWHNDWIHPDGMQQLLGPAKMYCHNVTAISIGAACINQPRNGMGKPTIQFQLGALYDWYWRNCDFHAFRRPLGILDTSRCFSMFEEWDSTGAWPNVQSDAGWQFDMANCFVEGLDAETGLPEPGYPDNEYFNQFVTVPPNYFNYPAGITDGASANGYFCDPDVPGQCGLGYATPGYTGAPLPTMIQRLENNTLVTPFVHP